MVNLRSVIAQVHRSIGSRRNFSTSPPELGDVDVRRLRLYGWYVSRFIGIGLGIGIARYAFGDEFEDAGYIEQLLKEGPKVKGPCYGFEKLLEDDSTSRNTRQESLLQEEIETMKKRELEKNVQLLMDCNKLLLDKFPDLRPAHKCLRQTRELLLASLSNTTANEDETQE